MESTPGIGPGHDSKALMLRGRFTVAGADDLVVMSGGQYVEIAHTTEARATASASRPQPSPSIQPRVR